MSKKEELTKAIQQQLNDITELLAKSEYTVLKKDDDMPPMGDEQGEAGAAAAVAAESEPSMDAPMEPAMDAPAMDAPAPEMGQEGQEQGEEAEMEADLKSMTDEELDMLLEALQAEKSSRSPAPAPEASMAPPAAPAPEMDKSLAKSMNDMVERLEKSNKEMSAQLTKMSSEMEELKKVKRPVVVTKPISSNKVEALEKSAPAKKNPERLEKSETLEFLENQCRLGNKQINTKVIADLVYVKTDEQLHAFQDNLVRKGVVEKFPTKI